MNMKAFITGISGFTGIHLVKLLKNKGVEVTGIDLNENDYYQCDLTDKNKLNKIILKEKPDYVFHLASPIIRSDKLIDETLVKNLEVDLFGTVNLLESVSQLKKKPRVLIAGTAAVYQKNKGQPFKETDELELRTAYGLSKLTQELVALKLAENYQIPLMVSRSILLIGSYQAEGFVVNDLVKQIVEMEFKMRKPVLEVGSLSSVRDFTDVRDGVSAYWTILAKGQPGEIYNVSNNQAAKIREVVGWLKANSKIEFKVKEKTDWRKNDLDVLVGDNTKLKKLGWRPEFDLEQSLEQILDYWRKTFKEKP